MSWETTSIFVGGLATLAIYSFFIKENILYRFFEHLFIGIAAGFLPIFSIKRHLWPKVLEPMLGYNVIVFPDGTIADPYDARTLLFIPPMLFGLLYYTLYFKRFSWMVKIVIGFSLGATAGLAFEGFANEMLPQVIGSFKPLLVFGEEGFLLGESLSNTFFVFTLLAVMYYFFFTFKVESAGMQKVSHAGRWLMMICFGAFFGSTVMARLVLLIERLQFLINDWFPLFF